MYKLELTEEEHEFLKFCMETILSTDWYASAECMEMAEQALGKCAFYFGALMMQKAD